MKIQIINTASNKNSLKDFTLKKYKLVLNTLVAQGYSFQTFAHYLIEQTNSPLTTHRSSLILLRHDVEARYEQALQIAKIQNKLGIKGTYFFRLLPKSFCPEIVKQIADLGHEIGYHYDDLAQCKGDYDKAIKRFQKNLETLREIAPVQTICMDGSPLSKYDNKDLWRRDGDASAALNVRDASALLSMTERQGEGEIRRGRDKERERGREGEKNIEKTSLSPQVPKSLRSYKDFDIIGEPYFDIDFNKVFYLTDTGRCWNGSKYSVRDKVVKEQAQEFPSYRTSSDIIRAIEEGSFPKQAMITFHPQRWNDAFFPWFKELLWQNAKNQVKRFLVKKVSSE